MTRKDGCLTRMSRAARISSFSQEPRPAGPRKTAQERLELLSRIPTLVIQVEGIDPGAVSVDVDGAVVPTALLDSGQMVNPGMRKVTGKLGGKAVVQDVEIGERERKAVTLRFSAEEAASAPGPAPPPAAPAKAKTDVASDGSTQRLLGWVGVGVGGAGLLVGGITALGTILFRFRRTMVEWGQVRLDQRGVGAALAVGVAVGFAQAVPMMLMPVVFEYPFRYGQWLAILAIAPFAIALLAAGPIAGALIRRYGPRGIMTLGTLALGLANLAMAAAVRTAVKYPASMMAMTWPVCGLHSMSVPRVVGSLCLDGFSG